MIKIYTTPACVFCEMAKEFLKEKGVKYKEYDVSKDEKLQKEIIKKTNQYGVPVLDINGKILTGFNRTEIETALNNITKKGKTKNVRPSNRGRRPGRCGGRGLRRQKKT